MSKRLLSCAAMGLVILVAGLPRSRPSTAAPDSVRVVPPSPAGAASAAAGRGMPGGAPAPPDSFAAERDSLMNDVLARIRGRENAPAESVFKNIRMLKGMPAGRVLRVMNMGYGKSLGVACAHCHVAGEWDKEDKPQKQITREMSAMLGTINGEMLPKIRGLKSEKPVVNCTTCHRGSVKPATNL